MASRVFPDLEQYYDNESWMAELAVLTSRIERLQFLKNIIGSKMPKSTRAFLIADSVKEAKINELHNIVKLLKNLPGTASLRDHWITPKKGYMVMLLCNLQQKNGHVCARATLSTL